jgi:hypothetical protein
MPFGIYPNLLRKNFFLSAKPLCEILFGGYYDMSDCPNFNCIFP